VGGWRLVGGCSCYCAFFSTLLEESAGGGGVAFGGSGRWGRVAGARAREWPPRPPPGAPAPARPGEVGRGPPSVRARLVEERGCAPRPRRRPPPPRRGGAATPPRRRPGGAAARRAPPLPSPIKLRKEPTAEVSAKAVNRPWKRGQSNVEQKRFE